MASSTASVIEHVVLLKVRDDADPSKVDAMVSDIWALASIDVVSYLATGVVFSQRSAAASAAGHTHLLHTRFDSKTDLDSYIKHPSHLAIGHVALLLCDYITVVDWVADVDGLVAPAPGSALRLTLAKPLNEGAAKEELLAALAEVKASSAAGGGKQVSYGENFSLEMAKGYSVGMLAMFRGVEDLDGIEGGEMDVVNEKVRPLLESDLVLDFVVPMPPGHVLLPPPTQEGEQ